MADQDVLNLPIADTLSGSEWQHVVQEGNSRRAQSVNRVAQIASFQTGAVASTTTIIPHDDTIPQNTEGAEFMSLAITPINALSTLIIDVQMNLSHSAVSWYITALFQDAIVDALAASYNYDDIATAGKLCTLRHIMVAGTTSLTTFKARAGGGSNGVMTFNGQAGTRRYGGVISSNMLITEILPHPA